MTQKINGIDTRPVTVGAGAAVQRSRDAGSDPKQPTSVPAVADVKITDAARQLAALERAIADVQVVDPSRVQKVARTIEQGRYHVRADRVADRLLRMDQTLSGARRSEK